MTENASGPKGDGMDAEYSKLGGKRQEGDAKGAESGGGAFLLLGRRFVPRKARRERTQRPRVFSKVCIAVLAGIGPDGME